MYEKKKNKNLLVLGKNNIKDEPTFLKYMREVVQNLEIFKN